MSSASFSQQTRPLSQEEIVQRQKLADFLDTASEDEFTEKVLVPLFQRLGLPPSQSERPFGKDARIRQGSLDEISVADKPPDILLRANKEGQD
jgi:hypothetical protein